MICLRSHILQILLAKFAEYSLSAKVKHTYATHLHYMKRT